MTTLDFSYVRLLVADYPACVRFYRDMLGFTPKLGDEHSHYAELQTGNVTIALFERQAMAAAIGTTELPVSATSQDRAALIFAVDNVDEATTQLKNKGISFVAEPVDRPDWDIRTAHFRDPDGTLIEINSRL
jgi:catechol 2,3-dioxygenase-like lactoylglutathione lyase family enzyme